MRLRRPAFSGRFVNGQCATLSVLRAGKISSQIVGDPAQSVTCAKRGHKRVWSKYPGKNIISMLALDLLLNSIVFINTLILQQILEKPQWACKLTPALNPLIWEHVNRYGRFELDMNTRLPLR
jgi:hypothetical protein